MKHLSEALLMSSHNLYLCGEIGKITVRFGEKEVPSLKLWVLHVICRNLLFLTH